MTDFEHMSVGMIFSIILEYVDAHTEAEYAEENIRPATAEDYLAF